jgi:TolB-like protein/tRNA A-37 threonylcarbamoyl transferase component Bud32/Flp pilus assembly protein TadD
MTTAARACPACHTPLPDEAQFCLRCGVPTPTDPGVPPRTASTGMVEVAQVKKALSGRYRIERVLGEGGMATVYLAHDEKHNRKVAVKVMRPELAATLGADRFLREVQVAAQLNHPNILPMFDSGESDGLLYYVMPYVEGETLKEHSAKEGQLSVNEAMRLGREVAEALAYAHARGIIHRDIKPGNILLQSGHALVADFGIARALGDEGEVLTKTGLAVGTPQYMAPEQATGEREVDGRADIYALGAVMYEMMAGEPPFTGPTARAIITRSLTEEPRSLTTSRAGFPVAVNSAVMKALAKNPADRYANAQQMAEALDRALEGTRSGATAVVSSEGPAPLQVWGLFALGCMGMLALVSAFIRQWSLPRWTFGLAIGFLAIGAVVLFFTGRMEARRRKGSDTPGLGRFLTWRFATLGGVLSLLAWAGVATALALSAPGAATAARGGSNHLAILPFENQGDSADAYFADGISDEIRGKLAQVNGLTVIASGSASQYRNSTKSPQEIAKDLGANYLLVGKVRWATGAGGKRRVQVVPELVDGKTGATTWQQSFDTDVTDIFAVQSQIASRVAGALGARLGSREEQQLAERPTTNVAAYDLYLKGKAIRSADAVSMRLAASYYEQAVALDSTFTDAWSALSRALSAVFFNGSRDPVAAARAKEAMQRAYALDPNSPAVYTTEAVYYTNVEPDTAKAAAARARALQLAPNDANVLNSAAAGDENSGNFEEATAKLERARELDPRSAATLGSLQQVYLFQGRFADAIAAGQAAIALSPNDLNLAEWHAIVYVAQGDLKGAREVVRAAIDRGNPAPVIASVFGGYYEMSWVLGDQERGLLFRLTPAAFDDDRAWWGQTMAIAHDQQGHDAEARAYADSALAKTKVLYDASPNDAQTMAFYGLMLAYTGHKAEGIALGERAMTLPNTSQPNASYNMILAVRIYIAAGEPDKALDLIQQLLGRHYYITPALLAIDPTYRSLRGNPRFERMVKGS